MVRRACAEDLEEILNLYAYLLPDGDYTDIGHFRSKWEEIVRRDNIVYFLAFKEDQMAATCNITVIPNLTHDRRPFAVIENVVSRPEVRRKGYARMVVEAAIDHARIQNCYKIILLSSTHRKSAHEFYKKLGFNSETKTGFHMLLP